MNISLLTVVIFAGGVVLVYSAVKDKDPRDVLKTSLSGNSPANAKTVPSSAPINPSSPAPIPPAAHPSAGGITPV